MTDYVKYKHISFDLWMTLIKSDLTFKHERNRLLKSYFNIDADPEIISQCVKKNDVLFNLISEKTGVHTEAANIWLVILNELGIEVGKIQPEQLTDFEKKAVSLFFEYPPVLIEKEAAKTLQLLRESGITLNILSNTAFIRGSSLRILLHHLGIDLFFDFQIYSDETGYAKPSPEIFRTLLTEINKVSDATGTEILHIGDNPVSDVAGGAAAGISSVLFDHKINKLSDYFQYTDV